MKKIFSTSLVLSLLFSQQAFAFFNPGEGKIFSDVKDPYPYAYQIDWLADNGVLRGYDDGKFKPENCVNRAEFLKMLYTTRESDVTQLSPDLSPMYVFSDIDLKAWYWPYLRFAIQKEIVQGYADKTFRPDQCVKRVEAVKMAVLEFNWGKVPTPWLGINDNLIDVASGAWYSAMMDYAHNAGILPLAHVKIVEKGVEASKVKYFPDQSMTRGEVAYLLYMSKALRDNDVVANDSSLWANGKKQVLMNEERGLLMPKQFPDAYAFDGCGKIDQYATETWYPNFLKALNPASKDPILPRIVDACFSKEAGRLIILVDEGYLELSSIYKYTVNKPLGALEHALSPGNSAYGVSIPEFGKRQGNYIPLMGEVGDAGAGTQCYFEYYFEKNFLALQRCRSISFDETVGGTPTKPVYSGSGKRIYGPWKIIK